jgi:hypothetical protein
VKEFLKKSLTEATESTEKKERTEKQSVHEKTKARKKELGFSVLRPFIRRRIRKSNLYLH